MSYGCVIFLKDREMSGIAEKWGDEVASRGFAQIPNYLMLANQFIDSENRLSPGELLILIQLVGAWWKKDDKPFPSMRTLSIRCGLSERQVQRAISKLISLDLLKKDNRRSNGIIASNAYDLYPLVEFLKKVALAFPNEFPRNIKKVKLDKEENISKEDQ